MTLTVDRNGRISQAIARRGLRCSDGKKRTLRFTTNAIGYLDGSGSFLIRRTRRGVPGFATGRMRIAGQLTNAGRGRGILDASGTRADGVRCSSARIRWSIGSHGPSARRGAPACAPGSGWVAVERARHAASTEECVEHARRAMAIAREHGDGDLEVFALSLLGSRRGRAPGASTRGWGCSRRRWRRRRPGACATSTPSPRPTATSSPPARTPATGSGRPSGASWSTSSPASTARPRCSAPAGRFTPTCSSRPAAGPRPSRRSQDALEIHARYVPAMGDPPRPRWRELRVLQGRTLGGRATARRARGAARLAARAGAAADRRGPPAGRGRAARARPAGAAEGDAVRAIQLLAPLVDARLACGDDRRRAGDAALAELAAHAATGIRSPARAPTSRPRVSRWRRAARRRGRARPAARWPTSAGSRCRSTSARRGSSSPARWPPSARGGRRRGARGARRRSASSARRGHWTWPPPCCASSGPDRRARARRGRADRARAGGARPRRPRMSNAQIARTLVISEKTAAHHVSRILAQARRAQPRRGRRARRAPSSGARKIGTR